MRFWNSTGFGYKKNLGCFFFYSFYVLGTAGKLKKKVIPAFSEIKPNKTREDKLLIKS